MAITTEDAESHKAPFALMLRLPLPFVPSVGSVATGVEGSESKASPNRSGAQHQRQLKPVVSHAEPSKVWGGRHKQQQDLKKITTLTIPKIC